MRTINIHEAKTHLSRLAEEAGAGEEIIIAKAGKPVAKLVPLDAESKRKLGLAKGKFTVPDDFDTMYAREIAGALRGETTVITRNGEPIAEIGPVRSDLPDKGRQAAQRLRALNSRLRAEGKLKGIDIRALIDEDRK